MGFKYPISLNLNGKKCVVFGGGKIAYRKIKTLVATGAIVTIVSPEVVEPLMGIINKKVVSWTKDYYKKEYLTDCFLVIAATNDGQTNKAIADYCKEKNLLINVIDNRGDSNFIVNSFFSQGDLMIAVSTNGKSPALSVKIKEDLKRNYGPEYVFLLQLLEEARIMAKEYIISQELRGIFLKEIINSDILKLAKEGNKKDARERVKQCLLSYLV